jgi:hypothetical protein
MEPEMEHQEEVDTWTAEMRDGQIETVACQVMTEGCLESKEPTSLEVESVVEHEEVPEKEATVQTFRALTKRYGDRHMSVKRRGQLKKRTQGNGGFWKNLATAHRGFTRHAGVTWRKRRGFTGLMVEQTRRKKEDQGQCCKGNLKKHGRSGKDVR